MVIGIRAANAALRRAGEITGRVPNDLRLIFTFQQRALPEAAHRHAAHLVAEYARGRLDFQFPLSRVHRVPRRRAHGRNYARATGQNARFQARHGIHTHGTQSRSVQAAGHGAFDIGRNAAARCRHGIADQRAGESFHGTIAKGRQTSQRASS